MKISQFRNTEGKTLTTLAPADLEEESGGMEDILQVNILVMIVKLFIVILIIIVSADDQPVVCSCRAFHLSKPGKDNNLTLFSQVHFDTLGRMEGKGRQ